jgi:hypothetical protein
MMAVSKRTVKLILSDFIETEHESEILNKLDSLKNYGAIFIKLCYNTKDIDSSKISSFKERYKSILESGNIKIHDTEFQNEFVWYEISCKKNNNVNSNYKFKSMYTNSSDMILCISELESFIKFSSKK